MTPQTAVAQNLRDAGCSEDFIAEFLTALSEGSPAQRQRLLKTQRCFRLQRLHGEQEKLERLDFLRYHLQKDDMLPGRSGKL